MTTTQNEPKTIGLFGYSVSLKTPDAKLDLSQCKVPGAWPEDEPLQIPGAWVECDDDDWCQHILCWVETVFGFQHYCSRHKNEDEVIEIFLSGLEL